MKSKVIMGGALAICMFSCSNESDPNLEPNGKEEIYAAKVCLTLPSTRMALRANDPEYNAGSENEYKVSPEETFFEFFDESYNRLGIASGKDINWSNDINETGNITKTGEVTLKANRKPHYVVAFINANTTAQEQISKLPYKSLENSITSTGEGKKSDIETNYANSGTGFFMTNSSYLSSNVAGEGSVIKAVNIYDNIYSTNETEKEPVNIYVERVVAKTTVTASALSGKEFQPLTNPSGSNADINYGVKITGWTLNATNKSFRPLKEISNQWGKTLYSYWNGNVIWNKYNDGRSFWAIDGNYEEGEGSYLKNSSFSGTNIPADLSLNYYSINDITTPLGSTPQYCFENTFNGESDIANATGAVTHVLLRGVYVNSEGNETGENVYRINKIIYTESKLKEYICTLLQHDYTGETFATTDLKITRNANDYQDRKDVQATISYTGTVDVRNKENLNKYLFGENTIWIFPQGICYYSIPIKHFSELQTTNQTGYYGVVRNHWYQIDINEIKGFGHPADPNKPIVPETITDTEWLLKCNINILSWTKKTQNSSIGGGDAWN